MRQIEYRVGPSDEGRTVKGILKGELSVSTGQLASLKAADRIFLDGQAVHVNERVHEGQIVTFLLVDDPAFSVEPDPTPVRLLYADEDILVIDKDAPLPCHCSPRQEGSTLENRLAWHFRDREFLFRPVNRLDKGTSGIMLAAMHAHAQRVLQMHLHSPSFVREYLAVVKGGPLQDAGTVDAPIGKADGATVRREVREDGKPSVTHFSVLERGEKASLLRLRLETGRTHQIRVHMAHIGCPVWGDFLYGQEEENLPGRFALHSAYTRFIHPVSGKEMEFSSPLPEAFASLLRS